MIIRRVLWVFFLLGFCCLRTTRAQSSPPPFDVVSIKSNESANAAGFMNVDNGGVFTATNVTARMLIESAYGVRSVQIDGGPAWISTEHFDIIAKPPANSSGAFQPMMRAMLADRFKLVSHMEMRDVPVFVLVKARSDGTLGPWIRPTTADCTQIPTLPPSIPKAGDIPTCMSMGGVGRYAAGNRPLAALVRFLDSQVDRLVIDRTGLSGNFDLNLEFAPSSLAAGAPSDSDRPVIVTALQEQLGLKLEPDRAPAQVLIVDRIERPSPN